MSKNMFSFGSSKKSSSPLLNPMKIGSRKIQNDLSVTNGIKEVREKLIVDIQIAADQMNLSMLEKNKYQESILSANPIPWNLRSQTRKPVSTPPPLEIPTAKTFRPTRFGPAANTRTKKDIEPRVKFSVALTREEIKNDFLVMTGRQPARRPKKRPKAVQNQMDSIFPGLWLTEITREDYDVPDTTVSGKEVQNQVQD